MKKIAILCTLLFFSAATFAQNTTVHDDNAQVRNVGSFHAVKVSTGIHLYLKQGNTDAVAVSASSEDVVARMKTEVEDGTLKIYVDMHGINNWNSKNKNMKAYVTIKDIDGLDASSGSFAETDGNINAGDLKIWLSSGAQLKANFSASKIWVDQSSGSQSNISGKVGDVDIKTSSGAQMSGYDLVSETCKANASSGGQIEITVNKTLDASASSGGGIDYKGNASITSVSNSSGGRVKKQS